MKGENVVILRFIKLEGTNSTVFGCFPLAHSLSCIREVCVRERSSAYEGHAYTSDVPYEGAMRWHLQSVLRVSLVTLIILHGCEGDQLIMTIMFLLYLLMTEQATS